VSAEETEEEARKDTVIAFTHYAQSTIDGELNIHNLRNEAVSLIIRKELDGALVSADGDPAKVVGRRGPGQLHPSTRLTWNVEVPAGGDFTLTYRYLYVVQ